MYNILIVEDDLVQRQNLKKIINELGRDYSILEASSKTEALRIADKFEISLFYIDINLNNSSGIDFALEIRKSRRYKFTWIVFITTYIKYMLEAFKDVHCYDYIIKPYEKETIQKMTLTLTKSGVHEKPRVERKYVIFDIKDVSLKIFIDDILFIEVILRACFVHTKQGTFEINNTSLKKITQKLSESNIIQCHRSFLVNIDNVVRIDKSTYNWEIHFEDNDKTIYVGEKFKKNLNAFYIQSFK